MTHEQFIFWLKGYTEGKEKLSNEDYKLIKDKLSLASNIYTLSSGSISYSPSVTPNNIFCGTTSNQ